MCSTILPNLSSFSRRKFFLQSTTLRYNNLDFTTCSVLAADSVFLCLLTYKAAPGRQPPHFPEHFSGRNSNTSSTYLLLETGISPSPESWCNHLHFTGWRDEEMYLYHLFHGQAIPVHWVPGKMCENHHCEYNSWIALLMPAAAWGSFIICHTFQMASYRFLLPLLFLLLFSLSLSCKVVEVAGKLWTAT